MELLKKIAGFFIFSMMLNTAFSQVNQEALVAAFSKSYALEKNGDFTGSMEPLKKVYDE